MKKILSINDSLPIQTLIEFTLKKAGHIVLSSPDEAGAMDHLSRESVDLIMLNITSEKIGWANILSTVKNDSQSSGIPVLTLTNRIFGESTEKAARMGADKSLNKPFRPDELTAAVAGLLCKKPEREAAA